MEILDTIVRWAGNIGCLFAASFFMFYTLVGIRFFDCDDRRKIETRWRNDNRAGRLGGVGIFVLFVLTMNLFSGSVIEVNSFVCMTVLFSMCAVGFIDDVFCCSWQVRMFFYVAMSFSLATLFYTGLVEYLLFSAIIFFFINSFNMLDNMDLISTITATEILFFVFLVSSDFRFLIFGFMLLPFLYFNWLGKLMMGDCGSTVLGALFGMCAVWMLSNGIPECSVVLMFCIPIADTLFVLIRRLVERRPLWVGGVDHLTHSLARKLGQRVAVIVLSVAGLIYGLLGILLI